jgi:hypothetical protein
MPLTLSIVNQFDEVQDFQFELPVELVPNRIQPRRMGSLYEPAKYPANGTVLPTIDRHLEKDHTARLQKDENRMVREGTEGN